MKQNSTRLVRKIWSLNPSKYKEMRLDEASEQYAEYLKAYHCKTFINEAENYTEIFDHAGVKTFLEWLLTEI